MTASPTTRDSQQRAGCIATVQVTQTVETGVERAEGVGGVLNARQADILAHASNNGSYVTGDKEVFDLAAAGLLHDHGGTGFWPKGTRGFTISSKGRKALNEWRAAQPPPPKPKRRRQSEAFEGWRAYTEAFTRMSFGEFWKTVWPHRRDYL